LLAFHFPFIHLFVLRSKLSELLDRNVRLMQAHPIEA
jgi:hypothetical protein